MDRPPILAREFLVGHRRRRCVLAAAEAARDSGVRSITVSRICQGAHMARNSFYEVFSNLQGCLAHGVALGHEELAEPLRTAAAADGWPAQVDLAVAGLFAAVGAEPLLAEMHLLHAPSIEGIDPDRDPEATTMLLAELLAGGRAATSTPGRQEPEPGPLTEEFLARMIVSVAAASLRRDQGRSLCEHHAELVMLAFTVFYGAEAGAEVWTELETTRAEAA